MKLKKDRKVNRIATLGKEIVARWCKVFVNANALAILACDSAGRVCPRLLQGYTSTNTAYQGVVRCLLPRYPLNGLAVSRKVFLHHNE